MSDLGVGVGEAAAMARRAEEAAVTDGLPGAEGGAAGIVLMLMALFACFSSPWLCWMWKRT